MQLLVKIATFSLFSLFLYFIVDLILDKVKMELALMPQQIGINALYFICKFDLFTSISIFISLSIAGWIVNKKINYIIG